MRGMLSWRRAASVTWLGSLTLVAGLGFACEVQAGCREVCTPQTSCDGLSGEQRWRCVAGRSGETSSCRTVCSDSYGAIAYSRQTRSWGHSFDHQSQARASRIAQGHCARLASDRRIVVNVTNQCAAIAETKQGDVSFGLGATKAEAERRSLAACRGFALLRTCSVATSVCSVR
jgi:uncharacterized protein DUF4189